MKKNPHTAVTVRTLLRYRWLFGVSAMIVIGAVMTVGLVGTYGLDMHEDNAIWMIAVIPPMALVMYLGVIIVVRVFQKRMDGLLAGIQAVAAGDLNVELDATRAGEAAPVYAQFNKMVLELRQTKQEMENFVNEFSHEFKTPITSIHGFAKYLINTGEGIETGERLEYLQVIADESMRLAEMSQKTLQLSKLEACQIITDKEIYDVSEQMKRCVILLLPQMEKKQIEPVIEAERAMYEGNAEMLEQVWLNLIGNAIKFTPEKGEIAISVQGGEGGLRVEISDNGVGMDENTLAHIFDRYYQHDAHSALRGNGVGLSIVHRIIDLCGGTIAVKSAPGEGSSFIVTLP